MFPSPSNTVGKKIQYREGPCGRPAGVQRAVGRRHCTSQAQNPSTSLWCVIGVVWTGA